MVHVRIFQNLLGEIAFLNFTFPNMHDALEFLSAYTENVDELKGIEVKVEDDIYERILGNKQQRI